MIQQLFSMVYTGATGKTPTRRKEGSRRGMGIQKLAYFPSGK